MSRALRVSTLAVVLAALASTDAGAAAGQSFAPAAPAAPAASRAIKAETLAEVTVTAKRASLARRVSKFTNQIAAPENGGAGGLARWHVPPVCPLVAGLPRQYGEFILERISQIGSAARVPLAGEHCRPNLYILVTSQPENLLRGMEKRNRRFTFGIDTGDRTETPESVIGEFIETPRAVRVWYNTGMMTPEGTAVRRGGRVAVTSVLNFGLVWSMLRVFVVVDQKQLRAVSLGQLADYVAMVGLADIKPGAQVGDAPTILRLFEGPPQAAPGGLSDWDRAFLKSLYTTDAESKLQRGQIARAMVRDIGSR